ncbi:hypothetical protein GIB67_041216 [Kingdonia uniflora]|uniref:Reverse transcriptase zinc-binding domain-containing protein n=1 Tax=Kingdonia uniflora TaxID=39325 RepID=A0A7J7LXL1_9MAGN|nr:hypothetical protein GIB67_041216 [Kingdonia uniflora]
MDMENTFVGKIANFGWRLLNNCIPTEAELYERAVTVVSHCYLCKGVDEKITHLLWDCSYATELRHWYWNLFNPVQAAGATTSFAKKYGADITVVVIDNNPRESLPQHDTKLSSIRWHLSEADDLRWVIIHEQCVSDFGITSFIEWPTSTPSTEVPIPPTAAEIYAKIVEKARVFQFLARLNPDFGYVRVHLLYKTPFPTPEEAHVYCFSDQSRRSPMPLISGIPSETFVMVVRCSLCLSGTTVSSFTNFT